MINFKKLIGLSLSALMMLGAAVGVKPMMERVDAEDAIVATYAQSSTSKADLSSGTAPSGSTVVFSTTYSSNKQLTKDNNMQLTLSGYDGMRVEKVVLSMRSNKSGGAGYIAITSGEDTLCSKGDSKNPVTFATLYGSFSQDFVDVTFDCGNYTVSEGNDLIIKISATTNSLYCQSFSIYYSAPPVTNANIAFDANGGSGEMDAATVDIGSNYTVPTCSFTAPTGKEFDHWNTKADNTGVSYNPSETINNVAANVTLYAIWKVKNGYRTITFNANGGSGKMDPAICEVATSINLPKNVFTNNPKYTFKYWTTDSDGLETPTYADESQFTMPDNDVILYAQWEGPEVTDIKDVTVLNDYYRVQGKLTGRTNDGNFYLEDETAAITLYDPNFVNLIADKEIAINDSVELCGEFTIFNNLPQLAEISNVKKITNTYNIEALTDIDEANKDINVGKQFKLDDILVGAKDGKNNYYLVDAAKNFYVGYALADYVTGEENLVEGNRVNVEGFLIKYKEKYEICCTSVVECDKYTVTFNTNGGTPASIDSQTIYKGHKVVEPDAPVKNGKSFEGWAIGTENGELWNFENDVVTQSVTLVAKWGELDQTEQELQTALNGLTPASSLSYRYSDFEGGYAAAKQASDINVGDKISIVGKINTSYYALSTDEFASNTATSVELTNVKSEDINSGLSSSLFTDSTTLEVVDGPNDGEIALKQGTKYLGFTDGGSLSFTTTKRSITFTSVASKDGSSYLCLSNANGNYVTFGRYTDDKNIFKKYDSANLGASGYASEMYIFVYKENQTFYKNVDFRMMLGMPDMSTIADTEGVSEYGIRMTSSVNNFDFNFKNPAGFEVYDQEAADGITEVALKYVILKLGDVINNLSRVDIEFTIQAYAVYNGLTLASATTKTYSVKSMIEEYYDMNEESDAHTIVTPLYNFLVEKGKLPNREEN